MDGRISQPQSARPEPESPARGSNSVVPPLRNRTSRFFKKLVSSPAAIFKKTPEKEARTSNQGVLPCTPEAKPTPLQRLRRWTRRSSRPQEEGLLTSLDPLPEDQNIYVPVRRPEPPIWCAGVSPDRRDTGIIPRECAGRPLGRRISPALASRPTIDELFSIGGYDHRLRVPALEMHNKMYRAEPVYYKSWEVSQWVKITREVLGPWSAEIGPWSVPKSIDKDTICKEYPIRTSLTLPDLRSTWTSSQPNDVTLSYRRPPHSVKLVKFDCLAEALSFEPKPNNPVSITNKRRQRDGIQLGGVEPGSDSASYHSRIEKSRHIDFIFEPIPKPVSGTTRRVARLTSVIEEDSQGKVSTRSSLVGIASLTIVQSYRSLSPDLEGSLV